MKNNEELLKMCKIQKKSTISKTSLVHLHINYTEYAIFIFKQES